MNAFDFNMQTVKKAGNKFININTYTGYLGDRLSMRMSKKEYMGNVQRIAYYKVKHVIYQVK